MNINFPETYSAEADNTSHNQIDNLIEEDLFKQIPNEYSMTSSLKHKESQDALMDLVMGVTTGTPTTAVKRIGKKAGTEILNTLKSLLGIGGKGMKEASPSKMQFPTELQKKMWGEDKVRLFSGNKKWEQGKMVKDRKYVGKGKITPSRYAASEDAGGWFSLTNKDILKSMQKGEWYIDKSGIRRWSDVPTPIAKPGWNRYDFEKAVAKQKQHVKNIEDSAYLYRDAGKRGGNIWEFEVPKGWIDEFSLDEGIPIQFLKEIHK